MNEPRPLFRVAPRLAKALPFASLGEWPTPVERAPGLDAAGEAWIKRDDVSSPIYGGNKLRTLEVLFGAARAEGATHIDATGAFGTNHGLATLSHAPRVGLAPGLVLFPQPPSWAALENLLALLARPARFTALPHWSALPFAMFARRRADARAGIRSVLMPPGGAIPLGALGYVSAALELAEQIASGALPVPREIVVAVGSTCTSAGLLVGLRLAAKLGIGFGVPPHLRSVRVTPWPVTARFRILGLAEATAAELARRAEQPSWAFSRNALGEAFVVDGRELGSGYGEVTERGAAATRDFGEHAGFALDGTYSAKSGAAFLRVLAERRGPVLFWSTKSTAPLELADGAAVDRAAPRVRRWIERAERVLAHRGELPPGYVPRRAATSGA